SSFRTITHATDFYTLSLHDALRSQPGRRLPLRRARRLRLCPREARVRARAAPPRLRPRPPDGRAPAPRDAPLARRPHRLLHPTDQPRLHGRDAARSRGDFERPAPGRRSARMSAYSLRIRRVEPHEITLHREVRLRALRDAPDAFGEAVAEVEARPASYWEELTRSVTEPGRHVMFVACEGDAVRGSIYGLRDAEGSAAGRVGGSWVEPPYRRRGIGNALLRAVISWARVERLELL